MGTVLRNYSAVEDLPLPLLEDVLAYLPAHDATGCATVCRTFKEALHGSGMITPPSITPGVRLTGTLPGWACLA
jgi:hypothetical protein